jgi:thiosulfate/3-mercaptopyruvate sulfurtransferase
VQAGLPTSFDRAHPSAGAVFTPRADESVMVKVDELKEACNVGNAVIWDVRSDGEYDGSVSRGNQRVGHIPGAVHLEWFNVMDRETHKFKPAGEVRLLLEEHGITPDKTAYAY